MNTIKQIENSKISEMTDRELEDIMRKLPTYLSDITDEHLELYLAVYYEQKKNDMPIKKWTHTGNIISRLKKRDLRQGTEYLVPRAISWGG